MNAIAPFLDLETWIRIVDGNDEARALFDRHYSRKRYADGRTPRLFVGPGSKLVLTTPCRRALFVWRKFISGDDQTGINCAIFRNEGAGVGSELVRSADVLADVHWGPDRHYTYVNPRKVKGNPPGNVFLRAGWRYVLDEHGQPRLTKRQRLLILERPPL